MLLDIQYVKANRKAGLSDYLYIIWKNLKDDTKHLICIPEPKMEIFFTKEEFRNYDYNKSYIPLAGCQHLRKFLMSDTDSAVLHP